ncbi:hypothetical protein Har1130_01990 [Haloarcula sp. CBA1130]|uniref:hypothetical protein n=1 Tax=unclassified Haloarcula TaxID=2624677 RepID=UPI001245B8FA|nr:MULTISPECIES: hypothetical protein [unclassified Haloarcula]KAA9399877.1 hypothetical protein Har1129_17265 [Haloarcula sp. CBA1129]KAA9401571.1 hypothetical protein Har1130_01990 [Haloarcula sp. CBA1130]
MLSPFRVDPDGQTGGPPRAICSPSCSRSVSERYNDCIDTLREIDEPFYDWSEQQIEELGRL